MMGRDEAIVRGGYSLVTSRVHTEQLTACRRRGAASTVALPATAFTRSSIAAVDRSATKQRHIDRDSASPYP